MLSFRFQTMAELLPLLRYALQQEGRVVFAAPNPAAGVGLYAGEHTAQGIHRPWQVWADVADLLGAHLLVLEARPTGPIQLELRRRGPMLSTATEGYGPKSEFARVDKLEDPALLLTLIEALRRVHPPAGGRVLALGVGSGRELEALPLAFGPRQLEVVGLDWNAEALAVARQRCAAMPSVQATMVQADLREVLVPTPTALAAKLGRFDLVLALSVLQSSGLHVQEALRQVQRRHLTRRGGVVLGFPNARYYGGEVSYGARMKNFAQPDLSLLFADVAQARRYFHKHGFKVFVTGKHEVLVTAIPAGAKTPLATAPATGQL